MMKSNFWKLGFGAICICAFGLAANAAPLQRADVMANPAWLLHLDCDALRPTTIGQYVLAETDKPEAKAKLAAFQSVFSFDLRTQLHSVTLYGGTTSPQDGVLLVYADFDADRLIVLAKAAKDSQSSRHNKHDIYSWIDENKHSRQGTDLRVYAAIKGNRVIFGQREDSVAGALDVLDGTAPSLTTGTAFPDMGVAGNTHFVEAAARKVPLPDGDPSAAILKLSQNVELVMGEKQQQFQGKLTLVADNEDVAGRILSIAQGLMALMKLQNSKPETVMLANALAFTQKGSSVFGNITLPASDAVEIIKAEAARKASAHKVKKANE